MESTRTAPSRRIGQADAYSDLGEVLFLAGKVKGAADAYSEALARYERTGNLVRAERTRARLLGSSPRSSARA